MKKNKINLIGLSLVLILAMAGCAPTNTKMRNMSTQTRLYNDNLNNRWMNNTPLSTRDRLNTNLNTGFDGVVRNDTNLNSGMITNEQISDNTGSLGTRANVIANRVAALPEVNSASVLIHGNTAIVGCDVKGSTTNAVSTSLRKKVEAAVKAADRNIKNVSITSDPTLHTRIRTLSTRINSGNPISGFTMEIQDILRRITAPVR